MPDHGEAPEDVIEALVGGRGTWPGDDGFATLLRVRHRWVRAGRPRRGLADLGLGAERRAVPRHAGGVGHRGDRRGVAASTCSGLPAGSSVGFTTGATMAHFVAVAAARHAVLRNVGWDVEEDGLIGAPTVHVVVGADVHTSLLKALRMAGSGARACDPGRDGRRGPDAPARSRPRAGRAARRSDHRVRPGGRGEHGRLRSARRDRRCRRDPAGDLAPYRRGLRAVGGGDAVHARAHLRGHDAGRFVDDGRPQVAQRAVRLRAGLHPRRGGTPGGDRGRRRLPAAGAGRRARSRSTTCRSSVAGRAGSPCTPPCVRSVGTASRNSSSATVASLAGWRTAWPRSRVRTSSTRSS